MKKNFLLTLTVLLIAVSAACAAPDIDAQIDLIARSASLWRRDVDYGLWCYALTDLDQNGRIEIIAASVQGTGNYTYINIMEVSEDGSQLLPVRKDRDEGASAPDIIVEKVPCFPDEEANRFLYIFDDYIRNGYAESCFNKIAVWLENGVWNEEALASGSLIYQDEENYTESYSDAKGNEISKEAYEAIADSVYGELPKGEAYFGWMATDNASFDALTPEALRENLKASLLYTP